VEDTDFKLWHISTTTTKNGIGIVIDKCLKDGVVDIKRQGDMIILMKLLVGDLVLNVISAYTPQMKWWKLKEVSTNFQGEGS
jgi:hypothetical protein